MQCTNYDVVINCFALTNMSSHMIKIFAAGQESDHKAAKNCQVWILLENEIFFFHHARKKMAIYV